MISNKCPLPFSEPTSCNEIEKAYKQGIEEAVQICAEIMPNMCALNCPVVCECGTGKKCVESWKKYLLDKIGVKNG